MSIRLSTAIDVLITAVSAGTSKDELATVSAHVTAHDVEFAGFKQALDDIRETVHQIHDDQHQLNFSHR